MVDIARNNTQALQKLLVDIGYDFNKAPTEQIPEVISKLQNISVGGQPFIPASSNVSLSGQLSQPATDSKFGASFSPIAQLPDPQAKSVGELADPILEARDLLQRGVGFSGEENVVNAQTPLTQQPLAQQGSFGVNQSDQNPYQDTGPDCELIFEETIPGPAGPTAQDKATGFQMLGAGIGQMQAGIGAPSSLEETGGFGNAVAGMLALNGYSKIAMGISAVSTLINMKGQRESAAARRGQQVGFAQSMRDALMAGDKLRG